MSEADARPDSARLDALALAAAPLDPGADERRRLGELAFAHAEAFLAEAAGAPTHRPAEGVAAALEGYGVPAAPRDAAEVLEVVGRLVETPGVATTSPRYLGYIPSGGLYSAALGDFLAAVSNRYAGQASISPGAAGLEHVVVRWLADAVGLGPDAGGVLTSGGSIATLTAVVAARDAAGVLAPGAPTPVVYLGDHTHHSVDLALKIAGLAGAAVRRVPTDARLRMDPAALASTVRADRAAGLRPFLLVATAGTTNAGTVDPLEALADVARDEDLWLHVDAAYGGLFALCAPGRQVLAGIERADSVVVDPHKTLFLPYGTGAVLVRDRGLLQAAFAVSADYLAPAPDGEPASPADLGPELTRHFRALRVWLPLQLAGTEAFAAALEEKLLLARHVHARLAALPGIEAGPRPDLSVVTFRVATPDAAGPDADEPTAALARTLQREGTAFLTTTRIRGRLVLRVAVGSFRTHLADVDAAVDAIAAAVAEQADGPRVRPVPAAARVVRQRQPDGLRLEFVHSPDPQVLAAEAAVLGDRYGNTAEELREIYGPYDDVTSYVAVRERNGTVLGWVRLTRPGALPLTTVAEVAGAPWDVDVAAATAPLGVDLSRCWDITTIGVRRDLGAGGGHVAAALYHGIIMATRANNVGWVLALLDVRVKMLLDRVGLVMHTIPGTGPEPYLGSPATVPVWAEMARVIREQRRDRPESFRRITLAEGLDGVALPPGPAFRLPPATVDLRTPQHRTA